MIKKDNEIYYTHGDTFNIPIEFDFFESGDKLRFQIAKSSTDSILIEKVYSVSDNKTVNVVLSEKELRLIPLGEYIYRMTILGINGIVKTQISGSLNVIWGTKSDGNVNGFLITNAMLMNVAKTKADKSTTLSGYGITDAYTKTEIDEKIDESKPLVFEWEYSEGNVTSETTYNDILQAYNDGRDIYGTVLYNGYTITLKMSRVVELTSGYRFIFDNPYLEGGGEKIKSISCETMKPVINTKWTCLMQSLSYSDKVDKVVGFYLSRPAMKHDMTTGKDNPCVNFTDGDTDDEITIPAYTSDLENDSGFVTEEQMNNAIESKLNGGSENVETKLDISDISSWGTGRIVGKNSDGTPNIDTGNILYQLNKIENILQYDKFYTSKRIETPTGQGTIAPITVVDKNNIVLYWGAMSKLEGDTAAPPSWFIVTENGYSFNISDLLTALPDAYSIYFGRYRDDSAYVWTAYTQSGSSSNTSNFEKEIGACNTAIEELSIEVTDINTDIETIKARLPEWVLPNKSIAVVGHEWNMYFDNVIDGLTSEYDVTVSISPTISNSKLFNDVLRITPTSSDIGEHTVTLTIKHRKTGETIDTATLTLSVIENTSLTDKKVLFIGDSLTNAGVFPAEIQHNLSGGGMTSLGTRSANVTIGTQTLSVNHEGRPGWSAYDYTRTVTGYLTNYDNPFYDGSKFNFEYYMTQQGYDSVDVVCIGLGTNHLAKVKDGCDAIQTMIDSIHAYNPDIKILISLITPPATQDGCGNKNKLQSAGNLRRYEIMHIKEYLNRWQNNNNIDLVELYFHLDCKNDFSTVEEAVSARNPKTVERQNNNVHPNTYGYLKFADAYYNRILYHLTKTNEED